MLLKDGIEHLNTYCYLAPGIPVKVMLAKPSKGINEILKQFKNVKFTCEYKYDGQRAQIHIIQNGTIVKIFSRNGEDYTNTFPDLISQIKSNQNYCNNNAIVDCELVAYDRIHKKILPFQTLTTRKRKSVNKDNVNVHVCIYAFDLLYLNGESLLQHSLKERRHLLRRAFNECKGEFHFADHIDTDDPKKIFKFLNSAIANYCEGTCC